MEKTGGWEMDRCVGLGAAPRSGGRHHVMALGWFGGNILLTWKGEAVRGPGPRTIPSAASVSSVFAVRGCNRKKYLEPVLLCCHSRRLITTCLFSRVNTKRPKMFLKFKKFLQSVYYYIRKNSYLPKERFCCLIF